MPFTFQTDLFEIPKLTPEQLRRVGGVMVEALHRRVSSFRNALDQPAKPYSTRGPIYVPVSGVGSVFRAPRRYSGTTAGLKKKLEAAGADLSPFLLPRNKTTFGGREVLTKKDLAKMRSIGILAGGKGKRGTPLGQVTPSGKSVKFANYAAYKKALGKSGNRDLELSGRMLGALSIVDLTPTSVTVGFTRAEEELKAQGNQARDPWFGLSPADRSYILSVINGMLKS